jgi:hypothetical protein
MKRAVRSCSPDAWYACLVAMNKREDTVRIKTTMLYDVCRCHQEREGQISRDLVVRENGRRTIVQRQQLWDLVQAHGEICE